MAVAITLSQLFYIPAPMWECGDAVSGIDAGVRVAPRPTPMRGCGDAVFDTDAGVRVAPCPTPMRGCGGAGSDTDAGVRGRRARHQCGGAGAPRPDRLVIVVYSIPVV